MFTDTHCHLYNEYYENIDLIIADARKQKIDRYINSGCDSISNKEVTSLVNKYENMFGTIGIHPEECLNYSTEDMEFIKDHIKDSKIIGIGEIGLDYHYSKEHKKEQMVLFKNQLEIAEQNQMPVVIHSREATQDTIDILKKYNVKGVIHSFSGSLEVAKIYIQMGFALGINGVVTFKNSNLKDIIKNIDINNIVLETDSPYLTPTPFRGQQNSPKYINEIADFLCNIYSIDKNELSKITNANIKRIFDI